MAETLAAELGVDRRSYAAEMFAAKSDVSAFSDAELLRMDSKEYEVGGKSFRVSVLETTAPETVLTARQPDGGDAEVVARRTASTRCFSSSSTSSRGSDHADAQRPDQVRWPRKALPPSAATPTRWCCRVIISRKKQIIPNLKL
jgi:manganese-dependent inorganic pyrophosphatase